MGIFDTIFNDVSNAASDVNNFAGKVGEDITNASEDVGKTITSPFNAGGPADYAQSAESAGAQATPFAQSTDISGTGQGENVKGAVDPKVGNDTITPTQALDAALTVGSEAIGDYGLVSAGLGDAADAATTSIPSAADVATTSTPSTGSFSNAGSTTVSAGEGETTPIEAPTPVGQAQTITPNMTPQQMAEAQYSAGATPAGQAQTITSNMTPQQMAQAQAGAKLPSNTLSNVLKGIGKGVGAIGKIQSEQAANQLKGMEAIVKAQTSKILPPPTMIMPQPVQLSSPQDHPIYNAIFGNEMPTAGISSLTTSNKKKVVKHDS